MVPAVLVIKKPTKAIAPLPPQRKTQIIFLTCKLTIGKENKTMRP
jgi:hypothetical protein